VKYKEISEPLEKWRQSQGVLHGFLTCAKFFDRLFLGMESPDFAEWLMTPTVMDRGGSFF
jgi:hypothetical protein